MYAQRFAALWGLQAILISHPLPSPSSMNSKESGPSLLRILVIDSLAFLAESKLRVKPKDVPERHCRQEDLVFQCLSCIRSIISFGSFERPKGLDYASEDIRRFRNPLCCPPFPRRMQVLKHLIGVIEDPSAHLKMRQITLGFLLH